MRLFTTAANWQRFFELFIRGNLPHFRAGTKRSLLSTSDVKAAYRGSKRVAHPCGMDIAKKKVIHQASIHFGNQVTILQGLANLPLATNLVDAFEYFNAAELSRVCARFSPGGRLVKVIPGNRLA